MNVSIVDYGIGNLLSVKRAFEHCGADVTFVNSPEEISAAERLVVPGVGAFKKCMEAIEGLGLKQSLIDYSATERPYLGICVGMQMLMDKSYELGEHNGLGIIPGDVIKMEAQGQQVPSIGWKSVEINNKKESYYFVHSYQVKPENKESILSHYSFGSVKVVAAIRLGNTIGVQFHPEKSAESGLDFLKYFLNI